MRHTTTRVLSLILTVLLCFVLLAPAGAAGGERVTARIPVSCTGANCTAVLYDSNDAEVGRLALQKGVTAYFEVECVGLKDHQFTIKLDNLDTRTTTYDKREYAVTVMLYRDSNEIKYVITANPGVVYHPDDASKSAKLEFVNTVGGGGSDPSTSVTVRKVWAGGSGVHPDSVTVQLSRGSTVMGTAVLNANNSWKHTFTSLPVGAEYTVTELNVPDEYTADISWSGNLCVVTNSKGTPLVHPCYDDPPVIKRIQGEPLADSVFTFTMKADDPSYPMPEGSHDGVRQVQVVGADETEFGLITFTHQGNFTYTVTETIGSEPGYTYDYSVYTVCYEVTQEGDHLVSRRTILKDGSSANQAAPVFVNTYETPPVPTEMPEPTTPSQPDDPGKPDEPRLPQTGTYLWAVPVMTGAGCALVGVGALLRWKRDDDNDED